MLHLLPDVIGLTCDLCLQSGDRRVLTAAAEIVRKGLAKVTLLGDPDTVSQDADRLGLDLSGVQVIDHLVSCLTYSHCA